MGLSTSAYGSDNDIYFSFSVGANKAWGYSGEVYRGPSGTEVPWKVNFTLSSEGTGTYMNYFLLTPGSQYSKLSDYKLVQQGSGAKYYHAYDSAYNTNLRLGAMNNNVVTKSYNVGGYWDEETAKHTFSDYN